MVDEEIKTSADELVELARTRGKVSIEEAAKILNMDFSAVQNLVDFLVEENIFGVEYKFTTPYIYLSGKRAVKLELNSSQPQKKENIKEEFFRKARERRLSEEELVKLWDKYLRTNIRFVREDFFEKAKSKHLTYDEINGLWDKYKALIEEAT